MSTFLKYSLVSLLTGALDLLIIIFLTEVFHSYYLISVIVGFLVSGFIAFLTNEKYIFHSHVSLAFGYSKSLIVALISLLVIILATYYITENLAIYYIYARLLAGIIGGLVSYILDKYYTFHKI